MNEVRVSVEWIFADIIDYFKFLDFQKIVKISLNVACAADVLNLLYRASAN